MRGPKTWAVCWGAIAFSAGCVSETTLVPPDTIPPHLIKPAKVDANRTPQLGTIVAAGTMYFDQGVSAKDAAARQNYFDSAKRAYQQVLSQEPHNTQAMLGMARVFEKESNLPAATQQYDQLITLHPQDATLHHEYGWCMARNKYWQQAVACFTRASELDPKNNTYARDLGYTLARAERFEESLTILRRNMSEGQACFRIALMAKHIKRDDVCKQYVQRALQLEPELPEAKRLWQTMEKTGTTIEFMPDTAAGGAGLPQQR